MITMFKTEMIKWHRPISNATSHRQETNVYVPVYICKEDGLVAGTYELQQKKPANQIHVKDKVAC